MDKKKKDSKVFYYILHIFLAMIVLFPLVFAVVSSFRPLEEVFAYVYPITWKTFIPTNITFEAYINLFTERGFGRVFFNTFFIAVTTVFLGVLFNSMAAFAFARFQFKGRDFLFVFVLLSFMIPFEVIAIPMYSIVDSLGWIDSYYGLILPAIVNGLVIFLFRQFFLDLPDSLFEAARIDGASWWAIYWKISMPLCKPVAITGGLLLFITQWESFMWPLLVTRSDTYKVIQVAMSDFATEHATLWNEMFAATVLAVIIPVLILFSLQKYFVQGITGTGTKD